MWFVSLFLIMSATAPLFAQEEPSRIRYTTPKSWTLDGDSPPPPPPRQMRADPTATLRVERKTAPRGLYVPPGESAKVRVISTLEVAGLENPLIEATYAEAGKQIQELLKQLLARRHTLEELSFFLSVQRKGFLSVGDQGVPLQEALNAIIGSPAAPPP